MTSGLHHITLITRKVQANVDFYAGFLGLRLVKRTAGFEDATQLHLFYGDAVASPGSLVTFLVWEDGSPGRVGHGAPSEIALAIRPDAIGFWLTRALRFNIPSTGPALEFGEPVLRLTDPDGVVVKLVGIEDAGDIAPWARDDIPVESAIRKLRGATILSEKVAETVAFLRGSMGFRPIVEQGVQIRLISDDGGVLDVRDAGGFWTAAPGTGTIDHIAVRAPDRAAVEAAAQVLQDGAHGGTAVHDRTYFYSLYVREPGGTLIELATDGPGFAVDEPVEVLGSTLFVPGHVGGHRQDVIVQLPQFGLPGQPRTVYRDLPFVHRIHDADNPDGSAMILLHGTGGNEASLMPFARRLAPHAMLIGLRGRANEEGVSRFFRRMGETIFDQKDIAGEAAALAEFVAEAISAYRLDGTKLTFVGHSNGANMLAAAMLLNPGLVRQAVLLRPMMVLDPDRFVGLEGSRALIIAGTHDRFLDRATELHTALLRADADVTMISLEADHGLIDADIEIAARWMAGEVLQPS